MDVSCDLEVDVNGEEVFMVDKIVISSCSGRVRKLFSRSKGAARNLKVIFHDFPGGAESFEQLARFCYGAKLDINPFNICNLHCTAYFMEMRESISGTRNLLEQTEKSLEDIKYWTWSDLLLTLKHCQDLYPVSSSSGILDKCLDSLTVRIGSSCQTSPCPSISSTDSSGFRLSCDTRSTESLKNSLYRATWWFEDLVALDPFFMKILVMSMASRKFEHGTISKFLFYYQKSRFASASLDEKCKIIEAVIEMLHLLDSSSVSYKSLFGVLRVALNMNISKCSRDKLESMIGSQLDQASLSNLLIPSPAQSNYLYDVNLVLRFMKSFVGKGMAYLALDRLKKVAGLIDSYIAEVAPDPSLKPSKFLTLINALPDSARESYDQIYHAVDMYLEVHSFLSEEEKIKVCCAINYEKLSPESWNHITHNPKFPSKSAIRALNSQHCRLRSLLQETNQSRIFIDSPYLLNEPESKKKKEESCDQIVLYAGKLDLSAENDKLRAHLQGMQWRVVELEKVCKKMQSQMAKIMPSRLPNPQSNAKSIPRLCS